jgi:hypothetical protein
MEAPSRLGAQHAPTTCQPRRLSTRNWRDRHSPTTSAELLAVSLISTGGAEEDLGRVDLDWAHTLTVAQCDGIAVDDVVNAVDGRMCERTRRGGRRERQECNQARPDGSPFAVRRIRHCSRGGPSVGYSGCHQSGPNSSMPGVLVMFVRPLPSALIISMSFSGLSGQPSRSRHLVEAAEHHRVGVGPSPPGGAGS